MVYNPPRAQQINTNRGLGGYFSQGAQRVSGGPTQSSRVISSKYGAYNDPSKAERSAQQQEKLDTAAVTNFVKFFTGDNVTDKIEGFLTNQAQTQVGELLANEPDLAAAYRAGDEDARATIAALNPKAQNLYEGEQARLITSDYLERYAVLMSSNTRLTDPSLNDEERATLRSELKGEAAEKSGLAAMQPFFLTKFAGTLAEQESQVDLEVNRKYRKRQKEQANTRLGDAQAQQDQLLSVAFGAAESQGTSAEDQAANIQTGRQAIYDQLRKKTDEIPVATRSEYFSSHVDGIIRNVNQLLMNEQFDEAESLIEYYKDISKEPLIIDGIDYFSQKTSDGRMWSQVIVALEGKVDAAGDDYKTGKVNTRIDALITRMAEQPRADFSQEILAELQYAMANGKPGDVSRVLGVMNQVDTILSKPTKQEEVVMAELLMRIGKPGQTREQQITAAVNSGLPADQLIPVLGSIRDRSDDDDRDVENYIDILKDTVDYEETVTANLKGLVLDEEGNPIWDQLSAGDQKIVRARFEAVFQAELTKAVQDDINRLINEGADYNDELVQNVVATAWTNVTKNTAQIINDSVDNKSLGLKRDAAPDPSSSTTAPGQTPLGDNSGSNNEPWKGQQSMLQVYFEYIRKQKRKGVSDPKLLYPPQLIKDLKAQKLLTDDDFKNPAKAKKILDKALLNAVTSLEKPQEGGGNRKTRVYPDPRKSFQEFMDPNYRDPGTQSFALPGTERPFEVASSEFVDNSVPDPATVEPFLQEVFPDSFSGVGGPTEQEEKITPQAMLVAGLARSVGVGPISSLMEQVAVGAPAQAKEFKPEGVINTDSVGEFVKMMTGQRQLTARARPQMQLNGNVVTETLPVALKTDTHPYFIAIGISEGTRTRNGGYTQNYYGHGDPGDGNFNRGTVSGGRNETRGMSPKQVDQWWMRKLTGQSLMFAPILRSFGVKENTLIYHRMMYNYLDLYVQSPVAASDFVVAAPNILRAGGSIEVIAKARADSYRDPRSGKLMTSFRSYQDLLTDQRSRAGSFDYKKRL